MRELSSMNKSQEICFSTLSLVNIIVYLYKCVILERPALSSLLVSARSFLSFFVRREETIYEYIGTDVIILFNFKSIVLTISLLKIF